MMGRKRLNRGGSTRNRNKDVEVLCIPNVFKKFCYENKKVGKELKRDEGSRKPFCFIVLSKKGIIKAYFEAEGIIQYNLQRGKA